MILKIHQYLKYRFFSLIETSERNKKFDFLIWFSFCFFVFLSVIIIDTLHVSKFFLSFQSHARLFVSVHSVNILSYLISIEHVSFQTKAFFSLIKSFSTFFSSSYLLNPRFCPVSTSSEYLMNF